MTQIDFLTGTGRDTEPRPAWSTDKFDDRGKVLPTPGLTTLCHIDPASPAFAALVEAQEMLKAGPHAEAFAFLPQNSFHMTVWDGVIDYRRSPGQWRAHLPTDTPLTEVETDFSDRFKSLDLPRHFIIRANELYGGFTVGVSGATADEEAKIRRARDLLAEAANLRRDNHDRYQLHITLAYQIRWLDRGAAEDVVALSTRSFERVADKLAHIDIGPVEFCRFETMHHFAPISTLGK